MLVYPSIHNNFVMVLTAGFLQIEQAEQHWPVEGLTMENNNASASDVEPKQEPEAPPARPEPVDTGKRAMNRAGGGGCS